MFKNAGMRRTVQILAGVIVLSCVLITILTIINMSYIKAAGQEIVEDAMMKELDGKLKTSVLSMAESLGILVDGLPEDEQIALIAKVIDPIRFEADLSGYYFVYKGTVSAAHPVRKDLLGQDLNEAKDSEGVFYVRELFQRAKAGGGFVEFGFTKPLPDGTNIIEVKRAYAMMIPNTDNLWISTGVYFDNIKTETGKQADVINRTLFIFICIIVAAMIVILPSVWMMIRSLTQSMGKIESGLISFFNFLNGKTESAEIIDINNNTEFGRMAKSINENVSYIQEYTLKDREVVDQIKSAADEMHAGRYGTQVFAQAGSESLNELRDTFNSIQQSLRANIADDINELTHILEEYKSNNFTTRSTSSEGMLINETVNLGNVITQILEKSLNTGTDLNTVAEKLKDETDALNASARVQMETVGRIGAEIRIFNDNLEEMSSKTETINQQATEIRDVVQVINEVADQTNLLALNAAIEAARAGDAGRGFAVVADEVRKLAEKTQSSLGTITSNIKTLVEGIANTTETVRTQSVKIAEVNETMQELDDAARNNARIAESTEKVASTVLDTAGTLLEEARKSTF